MMPPAGVPLANGLIPSNIDTQDETTGFTPKAPLLYPKEEGFSFYQKKGQVCVPDMPSIGYIKRIKAISSDYEEAVFKFPDYVGQLEPEINVKNNVFFNDVILNVDGAFDYMNNDAIYDNIYDDKLNGTESFDFINMFKWS